MEFGVENSLQKYPAYVSVLEGDLEGTFFISALISGF